MSKGGHNKPGVGELSEMVHTALQAPEQDWVLPPTARTCCLDFIPFLGWLSDLSVVLESLYQSLLLKGPKQTNRKVEYHTRKITNFSIKTRLWLPALLSLMSNDGTVVSTFKVGTQAPSRARTNCVLANCLKRNLQYLTSPGGLHDTLHWGHPPGTKSRGQWGKGHIWGCKA